MKSRFYQDNQIKNGGVRSLYVNKRSDPKSNKNYICILIILRTIDFLCFLKKKKNLKWIFPKTRQTFRNKLGMFLFFFQALVSDLNVH